MHKLRANHLLQSLNLGSYPVGDFCSILHESSETWSMRVQKEKLSNMTSLRDLWTHLTC